MSGLVDNHPLSRDFPEHKDVIHALKMGDSRFAKKMQTYEELDKEIVRIEQSLELRTDDELDALKMRRVQLKDALYHELQAKSQSSPAG